MAECVECSGPCDGSLTALDELTGEQVAVCVTCAPVLTLATDEQIEAELAGPLYSVDYDSGHGWYQAMLVREHDEAPEGASHTVFREDGSIAGYVVLDEQWEPSESLIRDVVAIIASRDPLPGGE